MQAALFVDDEQRVLDGLRRGLRGLRHAWDLRFALGGEEAVAALDDDLTVVVSDMRMPGLDGVDVLLAARERAPRAARVILSGNSDRVAARRAALVAHRFLAKPCDSPRLQALLPSLAECVGAGQGVAATIAPVTSCDTITRLRDLLDRGAPPGDVAALVHQDPALALTLLHVAASAFFAPPAVCDDVAAAVEHVGPAVVRELLDEPGLLARDAPPLPLGGTGTPTVRALAGLAPLVPAGALGPLLTLWGLEPGLVAEVGTSLPAAVA